jgi:YidC/Oxa1 family membrane protein insertase
MVGQRARALPTSSIKSSMKTATVMMPISGIYCHGRQGALPLARQFSSLLVQNGGSSVKGRSLVASRVLSRSMPTTKRTIFTGVVVPFIQESINSVHSVTNLPWWATISLVTVGVRAALFPLVRYQLILSRQLTRALPDVNFLYALLKQRLSPGAQAAKPSASEIVKIFSVFFQGVGASFRLHDVQFKKILLLPFVNVAMFCTFVYSIRNMITAGFDKYPTMAEEVVLWLDEGLGERDETRILPLFSMALTYLGMELSLINLNGNRILFLLKDVFLTLFILSAPAVAGLPAGVFFYWIPSSVLAIVQTLALRSPAVLNFLRIPALPGAGVGGQAAVTAATQRAAAIATAGSAVGATVATKPPSLGSRVDEILNSPAEELSVASTMKGPTAADIMKGRAGQGFGSVKNDGSKE